MIKESSIAQLNELDLFDVVSRYEKLDKAGKAKCPFHEEKSASFSVNRSKGIYKCFGCGVGGASPIDFVKAKTGKGFVDSCVELAQQFNIVLDYDNDEANKETLKKRETFFGTIKLASDYFNASITEVQFEKLNQRLIKKQTARYFNLGYAPDGWRGLTDQLIKNGNLENAVTLGLIKDKDAKYYDSYRNRVIIPILDLRGETIGFGGWNLSVDGPKYINSSESILYNKSKILFGLYQAMKPIKDEGRTAYLVEGYFDLISLYQVGIENVVATCGTALTKDQAKILKRHADNVVIFYDGDKAGWEATYKAIITLFRTGIKVAICSMPMLDPDDWARTIQIKNPSNYATIAKIAIVKKQVHCMQWVIDHYLTHRQTYIFADLSVENIKMLSDMGRLTEFPSGEVTLITYVNLDEVLLQEQQLGYNVEETSLNTYEKEAALEKILPVLKLMSPVAQSDFIADIQKRTKLNKATLTTMMSGVILKEDVQEMEVYSELKHLPKDCDRDFLMANHFAPKNDNTGYYFFSGSGESYMKVANFTLEPLFHIKGEESKSKRYVEIKKGKKIFNMLMDSRAFGSVDSFSNTVWDEGGLVFSHANKKHLDTLKEYWADRFPTCFELKQLGWQPEGFFAFSNKVYNGELSDYDKIGIYRHKTNNFLSPSITADLRELRQTENNYENDKFLAYIKSPVSFEKWMGLFYKVYGEHAMYGIGFIFMTIFRDISLRLGRIPLFYAYGATQAGKSTFAESILHFFFSGKDGNGKLIQPFQLGQGTDFAFHQALDRFFNCPVVFNEFDEHTITPNRFAAIKGVFDGEGRAKGTGNGNRTMVQQINSTVIIVGQFLVTMDDNSVVNRSVLRSFPKKTEWSKEEVESFQALKELQDEGLSSLVTDIMVHREFIKNKFDVQFRKVSNRFRERFRNLKITISTRLQNNYVLLFTMLHILNEQFEYPFSLDDAFDVYVTDMIKHQELLSTSDTLAEFFDYVELCFRNGSLRDGQDYMLETVSSLKMKKPGVIEAEEVIFSDPKSVIHFNLKQVHFAYLAEISKRSKRPGMSKSNLEKYLSEHDAFIGKCPITQYGSSVRTSSIVFDYDKLRLNLYKDEIHVPAREKDAGLPVSSNEELF